MRNSFAVFCRSLRSFWPVCILAFCIQAGAAGIDSLSTNDTASGLKEALTRFLESQCTRTPGQGVPPQELYKAFRAWATTTGAISAGDRDLMRALVELGFVQKRTSRRRFWEGLSLRPQVTDPVPAVIPLSSIAGTSPEEVTHGG